MVGSRSGVMSSSRDLKDVIQPSCSLLQQEYIIGYIGSSDQSEGQTVTSRDVLAACLYMD